MNDTERADIAGRLRQGQIGYGDLKGILSEKITARFAEPHERFKELMADPGTLDGILEAGADRARKIARQTLAECFEAVGLDSAAKQAR